jgi:hypothetical protein
LESFCKSLKTSKKNSEQSFRITQIHLPLPSSKNSRVRKRGKKIFTGLSFSYFEARFWQKNNN